MDKLADYRVHPVGLRERQPSVAMPACPGGPVEQGKVVVRVGASDSAETPRFRMTPGTAHPVGQRQPNQRQPSATARPRPVDPQANHGTVTPTSPSESADGPTNGQPDAAGTAPKESPASVASDGAIQYELFVISQDGELARRTVQNLSSAIATRDDRLEFEVVDILVRPDRAIESKVYITPTLIARSKAETHRLVGDLSDRDAVCDFIASVSDG